MSTLKLKSRPTPSSHIIGKMEVSLQQLLSGEGQKMQGYSKILNCCAQAVKDGWDYVVGTS
jgi:hypothetical protein